MVMYARFRKNHYKIMEVLAETKKSNKILNIKKEENSDGG